MKTIALAAGLSLLILSGLALASQSGEQKERRSTMEEIMKGGKEGEHMGGIFLYAATAEGLQRNPDCF